MKYEINMKDFTIADDSLDEAGKWCAMYRNVLLLRDGTF